MRQDTNIIEKIITNKKLKAIKKFGTQRKHLQIGTRIGLNFF